MNSPITEPCEGASEKDSTVSGVSRKNTIVSEVDGNSEKVAPDGGWGWWVVLGSTLAQLILAGCEKSRGVIYPVLLERFGANSAVTAWVISMTGVLRLCGGPVSSILSNRFGIRAVVMVGSVLICSGFFASSFAPNITAMFFTYGILAGIGQLCVYAPTVIIVGLYFDKRRALAAGLSSAGVGIGTFIIPPCVEICLEHFGYTNTFIILAGVALNLAVCGSLYRPLHIQWKITTKDKYRKQTTSGMHYLVGADRLVYSFGMIICFQGIGFLIGPTLSGVSVDYFKRYDLSFFFAGAITLIAGFVFLSGNIYAYRRKRRQS